jgi:hypothetical protein
LSPADKFSSAQNKEISADTPYLAGRIPPRQNAMNDLSRTKPYAPASAPDIVARLREAIEANHTTRLLLDQSHPAPFDAIKLHLDHQDAHLRQMIADLEGRTRADAK